MRRVGVGLLHFIVRVSLLGTLAGVVSVFIVRDGESGIQLLAWLALAASAAIMVTAGAAADRLEGKTQRSKPAVDGKDSGEIARGVYIPECARKLVDLSVEALKDPRRFEGRWGALPNGLLLESRNKQTAYELAERIAGEADVRPAVILDLSVASFNLGSFYEQARRRGNTAVIIKDAAILGEPLDARGRILLDALISEVNTSINEGPYVLTLVCLPPTSSSVGAENTSLKTLFPFSIELMSANKEERLDLFNRYLRRNVGKRLQVSVERLVQLSDGLDHKEIRDICRALCLAVAAGALQEVELKDFQREVERSSRTEADVMPSA